MRDIFLAEFKRFRVWAIGFALLHFLVLGFLTRVVDLAQQTSFVYQVFGGVYAVTGLLLGLYQIGGYRRPNTWLNLLHRPMPHAQVATALLAAGAMVLVVAILLPIIVIAIWQQTLTARVVDLRHWLLAVAACSVAVSSYLAGAATMLGSRRYAWSALVLPAVLLINTASGWSALAVHGLVMLWLLILVLTSFKADLTAPPRRALAVVATAVPLQMAIHFGFLVLFFGVEMLWIMQGTHPNNMTISPPGGHNESQRMSDRDRMLAGLANSSHPAAPLLREQVALSDVLGVGQQLRETSVRNQLTNTEPMEFDDDRRRVRWVFSHDSMRMQGYSLVDRAAVGVLGVGPDNQPLPAPILVARGLPALAEGDGVLFAGNTVFHYHSELQQLLPRIRLPEDEIVVDTRPINESIAVLSNRALYFFDGRDVMEHSDVLTPRQRVPTPGAIGDLESLDLIELIDGYLISFSFTYHAHDMDGAAPTQQIVQVDDHGTVTPIAQRDIRFDYPALYRYQAWWPSPLAHALREAAKDLFAVADPMLASTPPPIPRSMKILAASLLLLSLLAALLLTRQRGLSLPARVSWVIASGAIGLPALLSFWLLYPDREQAAPTQLD